LIIKKKEQKKDSFSFYVGNVNPEEWRYLYIEVKSLISFQLERVRAALWSAFLKRVFQKMSVLSNKQRKYPQGEIIRQEERKHPLSLGHTVFYQKAPLFLLILYGKSI